MRRFLLLAALVLLGSCVGKNNTERVDSARLYARAMGNFRLNRVRDAIGDLEKLESSYDFENYYEAMVMIAYAHYSLGDYDDSLLKIDSIKKLNMGEQNLQYVYYLEILNKCDKIGNSRRDLMMLRETFQDISRMLAMFPDSIYERDILLKGKNVLEHLVTSEMDIAKFYIENNNLIGALNHLRGVIREYPENAHFPEIFYLIYRLYGHIGYVEGRDLYQGLLERRYGDSKWSKKIKG
ncbi:MAG: outer membrane protein assembly factor BamD [Rickettsiales bacterium]|jgi:outer membrane assembly lipoprotein YfiO|nr:outer membrane protein assembly factor BamD [Rickettsiales bacterium]